MQYLHLVRYCTTTTARECYSLQSLHGSFLELFTNISTPIETELIHSFLTSLIERNYMQITGSGKETKRVRYMFAMNKVPMNNDSTSIFHSPEDNSAKSDVKDEPDKMRDLYWVCLRRIDSIFSSASTVESYMWGDLLGTSYRGWVVSIAPLPLVFQSQSVLCATIYLR